MLQKNLSADMRVLQDVRGKHHQSGAYMGALEPAPLSPDTLMHPADSDSRYNLLSACVQITPPVCPHNPSACTLSQALRLAFIVLAAMCTQIT